MAPRPPPPPTWRDLEHVIDGRIRKRWPALPPGGPIQLAHSQTKGMRNPTFLCYRNAVLQCLLHIPEFVNYLCRRDRCRTPGDDCVFCALRALALSYWSTIESEKASEKEKRPKGAKAKGQKTGKGQKSNEGDEELAGQFPQSLVANLNSAMNAHEGQNLSDSMYYSFLRSRDETQVDINGSGQQDAHEYLTGIFNMLKHINDDWLHSVGPTRVENRAVDRLFQFKLHRSWKCDDCGRVSRMVDREGGLILPMNRPSDYVNGAVVQLRHYLQNYFGPEPLSDVSCASEKCKGKNAADRKRNCKIVVAPEIMVIQLKRMEWMPNGNPSKIRDVVSYNETLDMSDYTDGIPLKYRFTGVVLHRGSTLDSGHYIANVRCQNGTRFARADDASVRVIAKNRALTDGNNFQSYLLMYQKVGGKMANQI